MSGPDGYVVGLNMSSIADGISFKL